MTLSKDGKSSENTSAALFQEFDRAARLIREQELIVVAHPDDVTDELRAKVEATPHTTLKEDTAAPPGKLYLIRPGLIGV